MTEPMRCSCGGEWVSVDDLLPFGSTPIHVLITAKSPQGVFFVSCCSYLPRYGGFDHYHAKVVAWASLPEPWNGMQKEAKG